MNTGFFIALKKRHKPKDKAATWQAELVDTLEGWNCTQGPTMEAAIESQKAQYVLAAQGDTPLPALVDESKGPMANGQIVRFVAVK